MLWLLVAALATEDAQALAALDAQIRANPTAPIPRLEAAQLRLKAGEELDRAMLDLDAARPLAPENPRAHYLFGLMMEERGELDAAESAYSVALALRRDYDDAAVRLAGLWYRAKKYDRAVAAYRDYVKAHPEATGAVLQLSQALELSGDGAGAEKTLKALYADKKTHDLGGRKLAELYERQGKAKDAAKVRAAIEPPKRQLRALPRSAR